MPLEFRHATRRAARRGARRRAVTASVGIGISYLALRSPRAQVWDRRAGVAVSRPLGRAADALIGGATDLGSVYAITAISVVLAVAGRRRAARDVAACGALAWTVAQAIKPLVDRPRPYQAYGAVRIVAEPAGESWPSGHVAVAAAMAGALHPRLGARPRAVATVLTGFVSLSRIYVGVHYLTDVVSGIGVGVLCAELWHAVRRRWRRQPRLS